MRIEEYIRQDGSSPYKVWFDLLDPQSAAKVTIAKVRMERGLVSAIKWFDGIGEYRIDWGPGYRIYLAKDGDHLIVLLGGGTKKRQSVDIKIAKQLFQEYKERKNKERKAGVSDSSGRKKRDSGSSEKG